MAAANRFDGGPRCGHSLWATIRVLSSNLVSSGASIIFDVNGSSYVPVGMNVRSFGRPVRVDTLRSCRYCLPVIALECIAMGHLVGKPTCLPYRRLPWADVSPGR